jgi:hypothetical protein
VYSRATGVYSGTVTVKNTSGATINGPLEVAFSGLPAGVVLANASGAIPGTGTPFVTSTGSLAPGASAAIALKFQVSGNVRVSYATSVCSGTL